MGNNLFQCLGGAVWSPTEDNGYSVWNFSGQNVKPVTFIETKLIACMVFTSMSSRYMLMIVKD